MLNDVTISEPDDDKSDEAESEYQINEKKGVKTRAQKSRVVRNDSKPKQNTALILIDQSNTGGEITVQDSYQ